ncbi:leucine-rich repeat domain-containing protein [Legionella maioricensis]|uniref:Leucine-rich repeat domain-containing protein n=1 Tax=Legionella maioricensis TaxID=2896528 RepID=A0A9X2D2Y5_9GAMM|nr:leucine-rich repeat domain-containing protein [Legionella maioricensis]MCL9684717.1 leucine-rich repeat domain-containing protein [Legionella maioricensis]MCL9687745.1 leucine-rich repeat domain-containing protein [Legionella maioricensis]
MRLSDDGKTLEWVAPSDIKEDGSFEIPAGVTSIGKSAFEWDRKLKTITIPEGVTSIDESAFHGCSGLQTITLPKGLTSIGKSAFLCCSGLQTITLPKGLTSIGEFAFHGCSGLQTITLPKGLTSIGESAFSSCSGLQTITIPDGVTSIGELAFDGCSGLQTITLPKGITSIGERVFYNCSGLQTITIPDGVTSIGEWAFYNCSGLQTITIPDGVTSIGEWAFNGCSGLETITLPEGIVSMGYTAFFDCTNVKKILIAGKDNASIQRITDLLRDELKDKVISKEVADAIFQMRNTQLSRVAVMPEINPLYRYFHHHTPYISKVTVKNEDGESLEEECSKLPDDIFQHMNGFLLSENHYYQKAKNLMNRVSWPKDKNEMLIYENELKNIADTVIKKAKEVNKQAPTQSEKINISNTKMLFWAEPHGFEGESLLDEKREDMQYRPI